MAPSVMVVSDLDHTMVQNEDPTHKRLLAFNHVWNTHCKRPTDILVFSTGRSPTLFTRLWRSAPLLTPDILICSVGTEIFYNRKSAIAGVLSKPGTASATTTSSSNAAALEDWAVFEADPEWEEVLSKGWDRATVETLVTEGFPQLTLQAPTEQRPHKVSYKLAPFRPSSPSATDPAYDQTRESPASLVQRLKSQLESKGIQAKVIFSGGEDLDILPTSAGKGCALAFLVQQLKRGGWPLHTVLAAGDSGNDAELMEVEGVHGCVVANAHTELREHAQAMEARGAADHILQSRSPCAAGIIEALVHFKAIPAHSPVLQDLSHLLPPTTLAHAPAGVCAAAPLHEAAAAMHGADTTASPPRTETHTAPGGAMVIEAPAEGVPESSPAITAAALRVAQAVDSASSGPTGSPHSALLNNTSLCGFDLDDGRREWVWRLGCVLAQELGAGWLPPAARGDPRAGGQEEGGPHATPAHSNLRLFVSNDCQFGLLGPGGSSAQTQVPQWVAGMLERRLSDPELPVELAGHLLPEGVLDLGGAEPSFLEGRTWIDQLDVQEFPAAASGLTQETILPFIAQFKVCVLTHNGLRSPVCWQCRVSAALQPTPVPEAFLAHSIEVSAPLPHDKTHVMFSNGS